MYFKSRELAGNVLATDLKNYANKPCAVVVLSDGGVLVAFQIAEMLNCVITMLLTEVIKLPGEPDPVGAINQDGGFIYNNLYSIGQLEDLKAEYHNYIDQLKMEKLHKLHRLFGKGGLIRKDLLQDHNIILVSDGLSSSFLIESAIEYLKPVRMKKLIVATPLASVAAVDKMHVLADEIHCLNVVEALPDINHYYDENIIPSHDAIVKTIESEVANWSRVHK